MTSKFFMARARTRTRGELDVAAMLFLLPSLLYVVAMFVYPFLYGVYASLQPLKGEAWGLKNYVAFFSDPYQYRTIKTTFALAIPNSVVVVLVALFLAYGMRRGIWLERTITTILVLPISLGVIFLSEGILGFYGTNGWLNQMLLGAGIITEPLELTHNFTGVILSLFMQQFPFCFLMLLGYISGIDPSLESSARMLGAGPWTVFRRVMLPLIAPGVVIAFALVFVMSFAVFPSAVMVGQPAGSTRSIAIAAYQEAFEQYDMSYASAIAVIMGLCQLLAIIVIVFIRRRMTIVTTVGVGKR
jgi:putative spermidine/putrescine transport system permease protein